jgi:hypothetical protein
MGDRGSILPDTANDVGTLPVRDDCHGTGIVEHVQQFLSFIDNVGRHRYGTDPPEREITDQVFW